MQGAFLPRHEIVLLGAGHTHAHVIRMWRMQAARDTRLTCVSLFPIATYSGMMPAVLAGQYAKDRMEIDLVRLCASSGVRLVQGNVAGIDRERRQLHFADRPAISYDVLSVGIGSVPAMAGVEVSGQSLIPIKPMQTFLDRLERRLDQIRSGRSGPIQVVVVGAGAGGLEIALCLETRLRVLLDRAPYQLSLVDRGAEILSSSCPQAVLLMRRELERRGVTLHLGQAVVAVTEHEIQLADGRQLAADVVLWATGAVGSPWLSRLGLAMDDRGFLRTRATLQTLEDDHVFAVGDTGTLEHAPTPKAGVFAVRQGPTLWENLQRKVRGERLQEYHPQRDFLKLFNLGDGRAIGEYRGWAWAHPWMWRWKDSIDSRFMAMYQAYPPPVSMPVASPPAAHPRCLGCGGKIAGDVLGRVLARLEIPSHDWVPVGLRERDDGAVVQLPADRQLNVTVDFFTPPLDDPYLAGRLALLHAASDTFAMGAKPFAALATVTLPVGPPRRQEELLYEVLSGALYELLPMGATLIGGHTIEGPQWSVGFTMLGDQGSEPRRKRGLQPGDALILTKPLGTGILLAAQMRAACRASWFDSLLHSMLLSNQYAASLYASAEVTAATDVTGFGLAGHLAEMLQAGKVKAELRLSQLPLLPGVAECLAVGIESTLAPANRHGEAAIDRPESLASHPAYQALFDPQTCGGLLLGVPSRQVERVLEQLRQQSQVAAAHIGVVSAASSEWPLLVCRE